MELDPAEISLLPADAAHADASGRPGTNEIAIHAVALLGSATVQERNHVLLPPWQGLDTEARSLIQRRLLQLH